MSPVSVNFEFYTFMYLTYIVITLSLLLMTLLVTRTDFLKNYRPGTGEQIYSLSKLQFAFWSQTLFCTLLYIWSRTELATSPDIAIGRTYFFLFGISAFTLLFAQTIHQHTIRTSMTLSRSRQKNYPHPLRDIVSDGRGVRFYRLQYLLSSMGLMIGFIVYIIRNEHAPEIANVVVALTIGSPVLYLVNKFNEYKSVI